MRHPNRARLVLALAGALTVGTAARGQDEAEARPPVPESADDAGFPWLCFLTAVAALGGLYVAIQRRERAAEADGRSSPAAATWYCRACDRDVNGPACPDCAAPNPFLPERPGEAGDTRSDRTAARSRRGGRSRPPDRPSHG